MEILQSLIEGNVRFALGNALVTGKPDWNPTLDPDVLILTSSDARLPISRLLDQPSGRLLVQRVTGNVLCSTAVASVEYSLQRFKIGLILNLSPSDSPFFEDILNGNILKGSPLMEHMFADVLEQKDVLSMTRTHTKANRRELIVRSPMVAKRLQEGTLQLASGILKVQTGMMEVVER